jgi:hypothetical protein
VERQEDEPQVPIEPEPEEEDIPPAERRLRETQFRVKRRVCENCLFSKNRLVSEERKADILARCEQENTFFICHEASERGETVCCRVYWDQYKNEVANLRLVQLFHRLQPGRLQFVEPGETNPLREEEEKDG